MAAQKGMYGQTPSEATEPDTWLAALDDVRRPQLEELDARIRKVAPGLRRYVNRGFSATASTRTGASRAGAGSGCAWRRASHKQYISFYAGPIGFEPFAARLPKANLGRGCIRFKRVSDVDLQVIDEVIRASAVTNGQSITY
jgi:hypothetical protein